VIPVNPDKLDVPRQTLDQLIWNRHHPLRPVFGPKDVEAADTVLGLPLHMEPAFEKFQRLVRDRKISAEKLAAEIIRHGDAFTASGRQVQYVAGLLAWLNQERWSDDLAQPTGAQPKQSAFQRNLATVNYFAEQEAQHGQARTLEASRDRFDH